VVNLFVRRQHVSVSEEEIESHLFAIIVGKASKSLKLCFQPLYKAELLLENKKDQGDQNRTLWNGGHAGAQGFNEARQVASDHKAVD
jgi:hypothetical protein